MNKALSRFVDKIENNGNLFIAKNGSEHCCLEDLLQTVVLGFCVCGMPEENIWYIAEGLEHITKLLEDDNDWDIWKEEQIDIHGNEEAAYFFYYWAHKEGFTEHGGSVPGWLTERGEDLLTACKIAKGHA